MKRASCMISDSDVALKRHSLLIINMLFKTLALTQLASAISLISVPIKNADLKPSTSLRGFFDNSKSSSRQTETISAAIQLTTKKPSVNIGNFKEVVDVMCSTDKLSIYFANEAFSVNAFEVWKANEELAIVIGQEWDSCDGEALAMYDVKNLKRQGSMLVMDSKLLNLQDTVAHYSVDIGKTVKPTNPTGWDIGRDLFTYPLNMNYNPTTQSAADREITLVGDDFVSAVCSNCFTRGQVQLRVQLSGTASSIDKWAITFGGNMFGTSDFKLGVLKNGRKDIFRSSIYTYDPEPITIQGLFTFDPKFTIDASLAYETTQDLSINTGFEVEMPFQYKIFSNNGITGKPEFTATGKPVFTAHAPFLSLGASNSEAHLTPIMNIAVNLFSNILDVNLEFDNFLVMDARMDTRCDDEPLNISLWSESKLEFTYNGLGQAGKYALWGTGRTPVPCAICDKCPI